MSACGEGRKVGQPCDRPLSAEILTNRYTMVSISHIVTGDRLHTLVPRPYAASSSSPEPCGPAPCPYLKVYASKTLALSSVLRTFSDI